MGDLMWVNLLLIVGVLIILNSQTQSFPSNYDNSLSKNNLTIFELGDYKVTNPPINVKKRRYSAPEPLIIVSPIEEGIYPVLLFLHGTLISNQYYSDLFYHIASHGYIVVAPQLFSISQQAEIDMAATVANWIPSNLNKVLQDRINQTVEPNINKIAVSGHSRGGKSAFALTLNYTKTTKLTTHISALIGLDPVAGISKNLRCKPYILTYEPNSFDISIPVTIIGTGLGNITSWRIIPCAPNEVSHQQFYVESKNASHFVVLEYGHMDMLDDPIIDLWWILCATGDGPRSVMRRTVGGIMVGFLDAYFRDDKQYFDLLNNTDLAPTKLSVDKKEYPGFVSDL